MSPLALTDNELALIMDLAAADIIAQISFCRKFFRNLASDYRVPRAWPDCAKQDPRPRLPSRAKCP
jgi:hypothetical protein